MSYGGEERRQFARIPLSARVTVMDGGNTVYLFTKDLSFGGAGLISDTPLAIGTAVMLEFSIEGVSRLVKVEGKVVRHFSTPEKGFGVRFTAFKSHSKKRLQKAIKGIRLI